MIGQRTLESLPLEQISSCFDAVSFDRGRTYARQGHVRNFERNDAAQSLSGEVEGNGPTPYQTFVAWAQNATGLEYLDAFCSCPVGDSCKHAAALILASRAESESAGSVSFIPSAWRQPLQSLVSAGPGAEPGASPLALQFDLHRVQQTPGYRETYARSSLTLRPVMLGSSGKWIKTGISWHDMEGHYNNPRHLSQHRDLLRSFKTAVDSRVYGYGYYHQQTLDLADMASSVWDLLERAGETGLELVNARANDGRIVVHPHTASITFDLSRDVHTNDVVLEPRLTIGSDDAGEICLRRDEFEFIGTPAHGLFTCSLSPGTAPQINLIRLDHPLSTELTRFVSAHDKLTIPRDDLGEFVRDFYPQLARSAIVGSYDGSVDLPELTPPRISLRVTYATDGSATGVWAYAYQRDGVTQRVPLDAGDDESVGHDLVLFDSVLGDSVADEPVARDAVAQDTVLRDFAAERIAMNELAIPDVGLPGLHTAHHGQSTLAPQFKVSGYDTVILTEDLLPKLRSNGQVDIGIFGEQPEFRYTETAPVVTMSVDDDADSNDWFDLNVTISIEGEEIRFDELFVALADEQSHLVLDSGTYLRIDRDEFAQLAALIAEARALQEAGHDGLKINRYHADLWDEFARLGVVEHQSRRWASNVQGLLNIDEVATPSLPESLQAQLRPYQSEGYAWLSFLYDHGLGGILADDMGLGKTLQALALIGRVREQFDGPGDSPRFLVVAPTSVVQNWAREAARFTPKLRVATIHETEKRRGSSLSEVAAGADVVVTSYALFRIEFDAYSSLDWSGLMLDEAQFVKNHQGKTYQCARKLEAPFKLAITGTPLENSLMDLWALLSITAPGMYPNPQRFATNYQKPIERGSAPELLSTLRRRIRPLMRRRTKEEVATDLPEKQEQVVDVSLTPRHARVYQTHLQRERQKVLGLLGDVDKHRFQIFRSLTLLRQLSLDPALIDDKYENVGSSKADALVEQLTAVVGEGHRALVFSQFTGYLQRIRARLDAAGIAYAYLDGKTRKRQQAIDAFKGGDAPVFLISLKAGGFGLNLTEADYCFVLDPWWNPATEAQAVDRTHRIGQTKTVMVYRYVAAGTIEEKVMELKARKQKLFASVMDGDGALSSALNADDIRGLLG